MLQGSGNCQDCQCRAVTVRTVTAGHRVDSKARLLVCNSSSERPEAFRNEFYWSVLKRLLVETGTGACGHVDPSHRIFGTWNLFIYSRSHRTMVKEFGDIFIPL